jgi:hypothetical protein
MISFGYRAQESVGQDGDGGRCDPRFLPRDFYVAVAGVEFDSSELPLALDMASIIIFSVDAGDVVVLSE